MAKYDLTSSLDTSFNFTIGAQEFTFRKPTVREMRNISRAFSGINDEADPDVQLEKSDAAMQSLYSFITPVGHAAEIAEVMANQTVDVQVAFNEMIQKELAGK